jgi:hypothetical protein
LGRNELTACGHDTSVFLCFGSFFGAEVAIEVIACLIYCSLISDPRSTELDFVSNKSLNLHYCLMADC